jgi:hypothetical protein
VSTNSLVVFMMPLKADPFVSYHSVQIKVSAAIYSKFFSIMFFTFDGAIPCTH